MNFSALHQGLLSTINPTLFYLNLAERARNVMVILQAFSTSALNSHDQPVPFFLPYHLISTRLYKSSTRPAARRIIITKHPTTLPTRHDTHLHPAFLGPAKLSLQAADKSTNVDSGAASPEIGMTYFIMCLTSHGKMLLLFIRAKIQFFGMLFGERGCLESSGF